MHLIDTQTASGRFNAVAPGLVSNREFTQEFSRRLHRPITWSAPAWLIRRMVGSERASILLEGQNVKPKRTLESGYRFQFPDIASALDDLVKITV
jgi:NAD dependent epimerase/dehydratase family enzyme